MLVLLQPDTLAKTPLNVTALLPCDPPNPEPVIVTGVPEAPDVELMLVILGATAKLRLLLGAPAIVTTTGPDVAQTGTGTIIVWLAQLVGVAGTPLKVTVLVPCEVPKSGPEIVTVVPTEPKDGLSPVICGVFVTVNVNPLDGTPPDTTTTGPVVAPGGTEVTMVL
jgi:hypothetical protein